MCQCQKIRSKGVKRTSSCTNGSQKELDLRAAENTKELWVRYKNKYKITQEEFATDRLGWSQGNFSQYLNGNTPIGRKSLLKLSEALECKPSDIREEFRDVDADFFKEATTTLLGILSKLQTSDEDADMVMRIEKTIALRRV
ncbi:helix-turn-helix domain-containing protein [Vibrio sp. F74]|uniref:helix-turn-helix domain-containing protein n=1 Tax=Vibrio sp. F74 TaxID=700020 RepID=UPI0035F5CFEC